MRLLHKNRVFAASGRGPRPWPLLCLVVLLGLPLGGTAAPEAGLPTVASTDLCADLLLLQLADPEQIVSVSSAAIDPQLSPFATQAKRYPTNSGSVEELLLLRPAIALVYQGWTGRGHKDLLAARGVQIEPLPYPSGWDHTRQTVLETSALLGRVAFGAKLVAQTERRMQALADRTPPLSVLYLRPNGGTAGANTYVDDLLHRLGLRNLAADSGMRGWGRFPLERLVANPPDLFLLGYFDQAQPRSKSAFARHPLFQQVLERIPAIAVPAGNWGCGGIELVSVAEDIVAQIDDLSNRADR
jgi:iron complex transport system substrate-binding protein